MIAPEVVVGGGEGHITREETRTNNSAKRIVALLEHLRHVVGVVGQRLTILAHTWVEPIFTYALSVDEELVCTHRREVELRLCDLLIGCELGAQHRERCVVARVGIAKRATSDRNLLAIDAHALYRLENIVLSTRLCIQQRHYIALTDVHQCVLLKLRLCTLWHSKTYRVEVGEGVEVITRATEWRYDERGNGAAATAVEYELLAIDCKCDIAGIGAHLNVDLLARIGCRNQTVEVGGGVALLRDGEKRLLGAVTLGITDAIDVDLRTLGLACTLNINLQTDVVFALDVAHILELVAKAEVVGSKDERGLGALDDAHLGRDVEHHRRGCIESHLGATYPLCSRPRRERRVHKPCREC